MATPLESEALEAIDKANGKRQTDLKDKQIRDAVAKLDAKAALQVAASGDLVTEVAMKSDGKGGFTTTTHTLRDGGLNSPGVEGYHASVTLGDADMHGQAALTFKDADKAKEMAQKANDGLEMSIKSLTAVAQQNKDLAAARGRHEDGQDHGLGRDRHRGRHGLGRVRRGGGQGVLHAGAAEARHPRRVRRRQAGHRPDEAAGPTPKTDK